MFEFTDHITRQKRIPTLPAQWIAHLAACTALSMITAGMVFHQTSLFQVHGVDGNLTVLAFQVQAAFAIVGNLGIGYLLDHAPARRLLAVQMLCLAAAIVQMLFLRTTMDVVIYSALMGATAGSFRVMDATVWARYFGRLHIGSIRGATMIGTVGGTALGTFILGLGYDLTGNYDSALYGLLVLPILLIIASFIVRRPPARTLTSSAAPSPVQSSLEVGTMESIKPETKGK